MFLHSVGKPTKFKKIIYISLTIILGFLLSFILHAFLEISYLAWLSSQGKAVIFYGNCALPLYLQILIILIGIVGGYFLGDFWWRKVYIERFWEKKNKKEK